MCEMLWLSNSILHHERVCSPAPPGYIAPCMKDVMHPRENLDILSCLESAAGGCSRMENRGKKRHRSQQSLSVPCSRKRTHKVFAFACACDAFYKHALKDVMSSHR